MLVSPEYQDLVLGLVNGRDLEVEVTVQDLQTDIDEERAGTTATFSYTQFNTLDLVIVFDFLKYLFFLHVYQ